MQVHLGELYVCFSSKRRGKISCDEIEKILGRTCCSQSREDLGSNNLGRTCCSRNREDLCSNNLGRTWWPSLALMLSAIDKALEGENGATYSSYSGEGTRKENERQ